MAIRCGSRESSHAILLRRLRRVYRFGTTRLAMRGRILPVEIRPLPESFYDDAVALWHEAGLTRPWNPPGADLELAMRGPSSTVLAALDGERLLGTAMVGHDGHRGWVYYLAVAEAERRRGIGTALMRACEEWLRERDVPAVKLMVRPTNLEVVGFYERLGYGRDDIVVMSRRLRD